MSSAPSRVLATYELLECILLQLPTIGDIIRAQLVNRTFHSIIRQSKPLRQVAWFEEHPPSSTHTAVNCLKERNWSINPAFRTLGIRIEHQPLPSRMLWYGPFVETGVATRFQDNAVYARPGSWMEMLATKPGYRYLQVDFRDDYSFSDDLRLILEAMSGSLLLGDVPTLLRGFQVRQKRRWVRDDIQWPFFYPVDLDESLDDDKANPVVNPKSLRDVLKCMSDDVCVKVVKVVYGEDPAPLCSLRRREASVMPNIFGCERGLGSGYELIDAGNGWQFAGDDEDDTAMQE